MDNANFDASLPFHRVNGMMKTLSALPTLPVNEWMFHYLFYVCVNHAQASGRQNNLAVALLYSVLSEWMHRKLLKQTDVQFHAQATLMLTPRDPLFYYEMNAISLYVASVAAKQYFSAKNNLFAQAALTGVLVHLFRAPSDFNAARYLWTVFHDAQPIVFERFLNVPISSFLFAMSSG